MQKLEFDEAVDILLNSDSRYTREAYVFIRDGLDHTMKMMKRKGNEGHVTGQQLCEGLKQYALKQYGPMVPTVFEYWGIKCTDDFGEIVWNLVELGVFGKTEGDSKADFKGVFDFTEAFVVPFAFEKPAKQTRPRQQSRVV